MSSPTWRLTINTTDTRILPGGAPNRWVVEGAGALPVLERLMPVPVEPTVPSGDRLAPLLGEDLSPFDFPTDGPRHQTRDYDRNYPIALTLPGRDYYAVEADAGNPALMSHVNAGIIAPGAMTDYGNHPAKAVGGLRLWVRMVAGEDPLTGALLPPAPSHLIRRVLKTGRL